jgi:putative hemolysin
MISVLAMLALAASACAAPAVQPTPTPQVEIANPASENCVKQGGRLVIEQRGDGGEYGICYFEDNRQCEEWALLRGDCRAGGVKVTGYVTQAAAYCAINGGSYQITANATSDQQRGTCTFKNGAVCDAADYYGGKCDANAAAALKKYDNPFEYCAAVGTVPAPDARFNGEAMPAVLVQAMIGQGIVSADMPAEMQKNAVWRCAEGKVKLCHRGANLPCEEMADASQTVSAEMTTFCAENKSAEVIPAAVTGRATVFEWKCVDGKPATVKQVFQADAQGFIADFWYEMIAR